MKLLEKNRKPSEICFERKKVHSVCRDSLVLVGENLRLCLEKLSQRNLRFSQQFLLNTVGLDFGADLFKQAL